MKVKHNRDLKIIKFLNGKAFYVVLCLCFVAIGVAMWTGVESIKNLTDDELPDVSSLTAENNTSSFDFGEVSVPSTPQKPSTTSKPQTIAPSNPAEEVSTNVASFFIRPLLGEVIKEYSDTELQYSMTFKDMRLHKGVDISGALNDPVMAAGDGKVTDVYNDALYGWVVVIDHGNGIVAKYCGLASSPTVKKGDTVDSSKQIGALGDIPCESVEPVHLHLEFTQKGKSVDPMKFFISK